MYIPLYAASFISSSDSSSSLELSLLSARLPRLVLEAATFLVALAAAPTLAPTPPPIRAFLCTAAAPAVFFRAAAVALPAPAAAHVEHVTELTESIELKHAIALTKPPVQRYARLPLARASGGT